jgi:hypothetical protein
VDRVHGAVDWRCARVHGGPRAHGHLAGAWRATARAHRSLLQVADGDEGDEAVPKGCSPEQEHR